MTGKQAQHHNLNAKSLFGNTILITVLFEAFVCNMYCIVFCFRGSCINFYIKGILSFTAYYYCILFKCPLFLPGCLSLCLCLSLSLISFSFLLSSLLPLPASSHPFLSPKYYLSSGGIVLALPQT